MRDGRLSHKFHRESLFGSVFKAEKAELEQCEVGFCAAAFRSNKTRLFSLQAALSMLLLKNPIFPRSHHLSRYHYSGKWCLTCCPLSCMKWRIWKSFLKAAAVVERAWRPGWLEACQGQFEERGGVLQHVSNPREKTGESLFMQCVWFKGQGAGLICRKF